MCCKTCDDFFNQQDREELAEQITEKLTKAFSWEWSLDNQWKARRIIEKLIQEYFIDPEIL
jgi:hypothetical protein